ncbi:MAG: F0F1 ATP synthase subunit A [Acidobacteriota bacterium]|nr:F0F1 ATP synthase subunit A [Acidobacteriota bacterium]
MEHPKLLIVEWINALLAPIVGPMLAPFGVHTSAAHPYLIPPHIVMTMLIVAAVAVLGLILRSRLSVENPGKLQIVLEDGVSAMAGILEEWIPGKGRQYMPLILTVGIFILISNYAGLVPGLMAPTSILSTTVGLAITVWVYYHFQGFRAQGVGSYLLHFAAPPGAPMWMAPIMLPIELISHMSRVMSLSLRLFGNVFGEELVIAVLFSLVPWVVPLPMMLLGLVTGGLQAFIFVLLTTIYLAGAVAVEHHDEHEHHNAPHDDRIDVGQGHAAATA